MNKELTTLYGNKVRVRVCGLCFIDNKLLLVNHKGVTSDVFWAPPGGGVEFGESLDEALKREFLEETGITIEVNTFLFGCELIAAPLHAIELFFNVTRMSGEVRGGFDPERQIIEEAALLTAPEIKKLTKEQIHNIFKIVEEPDDLLKLRGFHRI